VSWRTAAALLTLREQVDARAPSRNKRSDGTIGDANHQNRNSDHNPWVPPPAGGVVTALDLTHDRAAGADMDELAEALRSSRDPRIKYVIRNRRIFSSTVSPWMWRPYTGSNPHTTHMHLSVGTLRSAYDSNRPWTLPTSWRNQTVDPQERAIVEAVVRGIQEALVSAGADPGPLDGRWGPRTQAALAASLTAQTVAAAAPQLSDDAARFLQSFANARPSDARGTSLWHILTWYRALPGKSPKPKP
jgi:hypothetical protein